MLWVVLELATVLLGLTVLMVTTRERNAYRPAAGPVPHRPLRAGDLTAALAGAPGTAAGGASRAARPPADVPVTTLVPATTPIPVTSLAPVTGPARVPEAIGVTTAAPVPAAAAWATDPVAPERLPRPAGELRTAKRRLAQSLRPATHQGDRVTEAAPV